MSNKKRNNNNKTHKTKYRFYNWEASVNKENLKKNLNDKHYNGRNRVKALKCHRSLKMAFF